MSPHANVHSVPMLRQFKATLGTFAASAAVAMEETTSDMHRTLLWLRENRYHYWKQQVQICSEHYSQAKLALKRREVFDRALTGNPDSCVDEKKALRLAERRLDEARHKLARVKAWTLRLEKELLDYRGAIQGLVHAVEVEIPNARARLDKMIDSIEAYFALAPPEMPGGAEEGVEAATLPVEADEETAEARPAFGTDLPQQVSALRTKTPPLELRRDVPLGPNPGDWIADLRGSDALRMAIEKSDIEKQDPQPGDRIVLACPHGGPGAVYLERTAPENGDSGWYLGVDEDTELDGYVAVRVSVFVRTCPSLSDVLRLPTGCLVLIALPEGPEAIFDPEGNEIWRSPENRESGNKP